ncbi:MAG: prolipoprotein diacylglyceryl transferase [Clostridiales bacterium]|nr:prolipoprotein diacylglyceryl transferase [Clostridiales bacterium]
MIAAKTFNLFGLNIPFYGLLMAVAFLLAFFIVRTLFKKKGELNPDITFDLLLIIFPLSIIGARLYYVIFSGRAWSFVEVLSVWDGGLAIYGGIIGGLLGVVIYALIKKINIFKLTDTIAPALILGQAIGRIGCYFSGCCYGLEVTNPDLMWFPLSTNIDGVWHLSTYFYESFWSILGFILLIIVYNKNKQNGLTTGLYLSFYGLGRFLIEGLRGDSLYIGALKVSQVLSLILIFVGIFIVVYSFVLKKKAKSNEQKQIG